MHAPPGWRAFLLVALLGLGFVPIAGGSAQALALSPPSLEITDPPLFPGGERIARMTVFNSGDSDADVTTQGAEPAGQWITPEPAQFHLAVHGQQEVVLHIQVPAATATGTYLGRIDFTPAAQTGSGSKILSGVSGLLNFSVEATAVHDLVIGAMNASGTHLDESLPLHVEVRNNGNVPDAYHLALAVLDVDRTKTLVSTGFDADSVIAGDNRTDTFQAPLALPVGQYAYTLTATLAGSSEVLKVQEGLFQVAPSGQALRGGLLTYLGITPPTAQARHAVQVKAEFHSGGKDPVASFRFVGVVLRDGTVVASLESAGPALPAGGNSTLVASYVPSKAGLYTVRGYVLYDGLRTNSREATFEATAVPGGPWDFLPGLPEGPLPAWALTLVTPVGLALILLGLLGLLAMWRRARRRQQESTSAQGNQPEGAEASSASQAAAAAAETVPELGEEAGGRGHASPDGPAWLRQRGLRAGARSRGPAWSSFRGRVDGGRTARLPRPTRPSRGVQKLRAALRHPLAMLFHRKTSP